jgi:hypothetical protein
VKLFELPVVGSVYAQPLLVPDLIVNQQRHNVLYIATMHNKVYAFDADKQQPSLWERRLAPSIQLGDSQIGPPGYKDIEWEVGIVSTPVIDTGRGAIYVVTTSKQPDGSIIHQLWMLDIVTGDNMRDPTTISGRSGGAIFASQKQLQRSALLLSQNKLYVAFASYGDSQPYNGWVFSFDASTLALLKTFCTTPGHNGLGGIWQAGQGLAADDQGNVYFMTGNGDFGPSQGNFGDSVLKLDPDLNRLGFFSPHNNAELNDNDLDLGSGGILAIPGTNLILGGGKEARLYLMDMAKLGDFDPHVDHVLDVFPCSATDGRHHIHGSPVFWSGPDGPRIYVWTENDACKAFQFLGNSFNHNPVAQSTVPVPSGMPGGFLTISANGGQDGILWASHPWADDLNQRIGEGVLRAFDARTLRELWDSRNNRTRDDFGNFAKFCPPTVANGSVYMATMGGLSHKVTPDERPLGGPAMINRNDVDLVLGWSGTESHLNVMLSIDGIAWGQKVTIQSETTSNAMALAFNAGEPPNGRTFISWTGTDGDHSLNVMSTVDPTLRNWSNKHTLPDARSHHGPALLFTNGRLFIAWTGSDDRLNIMSSSDLGASWQNKRTLTETSPDGPALAFLNGNLILMWNGTDSAHDLNFIQSSDGGLTWGNKVTIDERSGRHPAMAIGADQLPYFCWAGLDNEQINLLHSENGSTNGFGASPSYFPAQNAYFRVERCVSQDRKAPPV